MTWTRPGRRALIAVLTVVAALLPVSLIAAVSAFGDAGGPSGSSTGPAIVGFSPQEGPIGGGTVVKISGGGFETATGVTFGGRPAASFEVKSPNLIEATSPEMPRGVNVRIHVAAPGGTAAANRDFTFIGCHVPQVRGAQVQRARKTIVEAGCKVGQVKPGRTATKPLRVIGVSPQPGTWAEPGTAVDLLVR
jgi:IPT/TIG domain/PASTA domain